MMWLSLGALVVLIWLFLWSIMSLASRADDIIERDFDRWPGA